MTVAHLAEALGVAPSTASRMCERLVAKKLIRRAVDRSNRRQVRLGLRAEGRALRVLVQAAQAEDRTRPNAVTPRR